MIKLTLIENNIINNYDTLYILLNIQGKEFSLFDNHAEMKIILIDAECTINIELEDKNYLFPQKRDVVIFKDKKGFLTLKNNEAICFIE